MGIDRHGAGKGANGPAPMAVPGWRDRLARRVPAQSLAAFRIAFGALLVWDCWRFIKYDRIHRYYVEPELHFTYPGFGWVAPLPELWLQIAWLMVGVTAFLVMIGLFYRVAIVGFTLLFMYFFLLDQAQYLNHFYLVILFAVLLCFLPAHRAASVDARLWPARHAAGVPHAAVFVLRAQIEIMLIFAGLVKITPDWLAGEPLGMWLRREAGSGLVGHVLSQDWVILAGTLGTVALHVLGAPLLLFARTRMPVFIVYCLFHLANAQVFNIGIFPWLTIAATTIFFAPDWPRRAARWLLSRFEDLPPATLVTPAPARALPPLAVAGIAVWIAVQIALPLRAGFFPTEVRWSGDGHRFSWRMKIHDRKADGVFHVVDRATGTRWIVEPEMFLTSRQARKMLVRSDMVHQFAGHLQALWAANGHPDVAVHADIRKSLNGRPMQPFIDRGTDLAAARYNLFGPDRWVVPLQVPVWGVGRNATAGNTGARVAAAGAN